MIDRRGFYIDTKDDFLSNCSISKGAKFRVTVSVNADHENDLVTRILLDKTPIRSISKRRKTVEISDYGL
jgi:hypothetical protein